MPVPNIRVNALLPFPARVQGTGGIDVQKANGIWTIRPDFSALAELLPGALTDPSGKQIWIFDPITEEYSVLTLAGLGDALYTATSTTSLGIGAGSKTFATQAGKDFDVGTYVLATSDADPANYMLGRVTDYTSGSLTLSVGSTGVGGSGTHADWTLHLSGAPGVTLPGVSYTWSSNTASSDPGTGKIKLNHATIASATSIFISETDADANSLAAWLATWDDGTSAVKGTVRITKVSAPGSFAIFNVTGTVTDNGTWDTFSATYIASGGSFLDGDALKVEFYRAGDAGTGDFSSNTATSVDGELVLFSGTGGKTGKRATTTGLLKGASGVVSAATAGTDYVKPDTTSNFSAGFTATSFSNGTKSTGTFTPDAANGNIQHYTNGGAHTLAPQASPSTIILECTNASAGAITTSGFDVVTGDTYSSTGTKKHIFYLTRTNTYKHLHVVYVTGT